ncbi:C5a anaphylatoxin chemotactic receptor 1-like [Mustelus asterias]
MEVSTPPQEDNKCNVTTEDIVAGTFLGLVFLVGVLGNLLVIWVVLRHVKQRSVTLHLILNLAVADLLTVITIPVVILRMMVSCSLGTSNAVRPTTIYLILSVMYASVFSITAISVLRLLSVTRATFLQKWQRRGITGKVVAVIWVSALLLAGPAFINSKLTRTCNGRNIQRRQAADILGILVGFVIPFTVMSVCYALVFKRLKQITFQTKNKAGTVIVMVIVAFALCWLPFHIINMVIISFLHGSFSETCQIFLHLDRFAVVLPFVSGCINPIFYAFTFENFKSGLKLLNIIKLFDEMNIRSNEQSDKATADMEEKGDLSAK